MEKLVTLDRGKIYQDLWRLSWPVMIFMVFQTTLELVDLYWVGYLGTDAVAALSLSNSLFWMLFTFSDLISISTLALVARYRGAGDTGNVAVVARHSFWLAGFISIAVTVLILGLSNTFISLYSVEPQVHEMAVLYLKIIGVSMLFAYSGMAMGAVLQGVGDTRTPMIILVTTNIINIVLDPILIFGLLGAPKMGILGAALATLLARAVGFACMFYILISGKISPSKLRVPGLLKLKFKAAYFKRLIGIGLPAFMQTLTRPLTGLVLMWLVALFGTGAIAAFGIGMRVLGLSFILLSGLTVGTSTMIGQSIGAARRSLTLEIIRKAMLLSLAVQVGMTALCFFAAPHIVGLFTGDPVALELGINYLRIISACMILMGPFHIIDAVFKGSGYT
ncbi:MAG: MATE family efflux transporter, partial [Firmicutes bacterium]|nr:MATE family efflux transporter [Bacillota bacterium]